MDASRRTSIPEHFRSAEEAGEFWDTHSAADYWDEMAEMAMTFDLQDRLLMVPISDLIFDRVKQRAELENRSVGEMVSLLLEHELA
jgi:hypothetical protein